MASSPFPGAPISCSVLPLSGNEEFIPFIAKIGEERGGHSKGGRWGGGGGGHGNDHTCVQVICCVHDV